MPAFQGSLLDADDALECRPLAGSVRRTHLSDGAWIDLRPGWVGGSDELFGLLRPTGGGRSIRYVVGHGDLLVMGGSCQRTWEHAVPKVDPSVGPRISIQFRPRDVR